LIANQVALDIEYAGGEPKPLVTRKQVAAFGTGIV
jgi:hypothetical protein